MIEHIVAYGYMIQKGKNTISRYGTSTIVNRGVPKDYLAMQKSLAEELLKEEGMQSLDDLVFNYFTILHKEEE